MNAMTGSSVRARVLADAAGFAAVAAAVVGVLHGLPDSRYITPRATLNSYIRCVLAVDETGELATATPELRARAERQRGPDLVLRRERLKGKAALFRATPIQFVREKVWEDRAKILVTQGGPAERPDPWVYSFEKIGREWKISAIERTGLMGW